MINDRGTASKKAKELGFKSLKQVKGMLGTNKNGHPMVSDQTLINWFNDKSELFEVVLLGCATKLGLVTQTVVSGAPFSAPCGWTRGEALIVGKMEVQYRHVWYLEQSYNMPLCANEAFNTGNIALQWFNTKEDCFNFLAWWHEAR